MYVFTNPEYKSSFIQALQVPPETSDLDSQPNNMESPQSIVSQSSETRTGTQQITDVTLYTQKIVSLWDVYITFHVVVGHQPRC